LPAARVLSAMDRQDDDVFTDHPEVDSVRETIEERSPRVSACALKQQRVFNDVFNRVVKSRAKGSAEARLPRFVPLSRFECFRRSLRSKTDPAVHSRSISFRRTSSHGIANSGR